MFLPVSLSRMAGGQDTFFHRPIINYEMTCNSDASLICNTHPHASGQSPTRHLTEGCHYIELHIFISFGHMSHNCLSVRNLITRIDCITFFQPNTIHDWQKWDSRLSFEEHISVLKTQCREALNLIRVVAHLKWGGDRDTLLMLYRAIVHSKAFGMLLRIYDGASRGPSILFNWVGDTLARGPVSVFETVLALETEGLWASPTGVVFWVLPTEVALWTPILWALPTEVVLVFWTLTAMSAWVPPSMDFSKVCSLCS